MNGRNLRRFPWEISQWITEGIVERISWVIPEGILRKSFSWNLKEIINNNFVGNTWDKDSTFEFGAKTVQPLISSPNSVSRNNYCTVTSKPYVHILFPPPFQFSLNCTNFLTIHRSYKRKRKLARIQVSHLRNLWRKYLVYSARYSERESWRKS